MLVMPFTIRLSDCPTDISESSTASEAHFEAYSLLQEQIAILFSSALDNMDVVPEPIGIYPRHAGKREMLCAELTVSHNIKRLYQL
jgi:hypothetical protein